MTPTWRNHVHVRVARAIAVGGAALGLVLGPTPARATPAALAFVGTATVVPALNHPVLGPGRSGSWAFAIATGVGVTAGEVDVAAGALSGSFGEGVLQDVVGGPVSGGAYCGASGGSDGSGTITIGSTHIALSNIGWKQSAATLIPLTNANGTILGANFVGLVSAIPPFPVIGVPGSCLNGTARDFTIVGAAVSLA